MKTYIYPIATIFMILFVTEAAQAACPVRPKQKYQVCSERITVNGGKFTIEQARDRSEPNPNHVMSAGSPTAFNFIADNSHQAATYITMNLMKIGTKQMDGETFGIYRLTDEIGLLIRAGDFNNVNERMPHTVRNEEQGRLTRVLPPEHSHLEFVPRIAKSLGFGIKAYPILLSPKTSGLVEFPGGTKIMTVSMRSLGNKVRGQTSFPVFMGKFSIEKRIRTCRLTSNKDVTLTFPTVSKRSFPNIGSLVYGATTDISLTCDPNVEVWATLSDVNVPSNTSDILSIEPGTGKAKNVGIKLFKNNDQRALKYGLQSSQIGNPNSWKFSDRNINARTNPSIKLTGYYVRTGTITPGNVNAQAVITFSYQ